LVVNYHSPSLVANFLATDKAKIVPSLSASYSSRLFCEKRYAPAPDPFSNNNDMDLADEMLDFYFPQFLPYDIIPTVHAKIRG
jgi:hypothetical protein